MAITHVNTQTAVQNGALTSVTVTKPTGTTTNDLLVAVIVSNAFGVGLPSGWTSRGNVTESTLRLEIYTKIAGGSEPANYTWTVNSSKMSGLVGFVTAWRGCDTTTPIDITPSMETSGPHSEPYTTPSISGGTAGRVLYFRAGKVSTTTTYSESTAGVSEIADVCNTPLGSVAYSGALYADDADYSTSGTKNGLAITSSTAEEEAAVATWAIRSGTPPNSGTLTVALPLLDVDISGGLTSSASLAMTLPSVSNVSFEGEVYPTEATLDTVVPVSMDVGGVLPIAGVLGTVIAPAMASQGETRRFAENVVNINDESRWLIILQDEIRIGSRKTAKKEAVLSTVVDVSVDIRLHVQTQAESVAVGAEAFDAAVQAVDAGSVIGGQAVISVAANNATVRISPKPSTVAANCHN